MKVVNIFLLLLVLSANAVAQGDNEDPQFKSSADLQIVQASVVYDDRLEQLIFSLEVKGEAGRSVPEAHGQLDGAPVLGYVFPTTLQPTDVGFSATEGIVALALTSHPDFDDTPLWDEDNDRNYANDGVVWHPHWVVLREDKRAAGGLSVIQFDPGQDQVTLPPTNPGMPMYMDSPGYQVIRKGNVIRTVVPASRINHRTSFKFDAVTVYMQVNASRKDLPMLGAYAVYSIASGNLSLPYLVSR